MYSEDLLILLSLVSDETNKKVEQWLPDGNLGKELNLEQRAHWNERRNETRSQLIRAGKIREQ
jgi:hypothetical protein